MDIHGRLVHDRPPAEVFAMFIDPAYVRARAEATGGVDVVATVHADGDCTEVVNRRTVAADLPTFARQFVGDHLRINETHVWGAVTGGVREGTFEATFDGAPVVMRGQMRMTADGDGSLTTLDGQITASLPLVGRKVEALVHEQVSAAFAVEQRLGTTWWAAVETD